MERLGEPDTSLVFLGALQDRGFVFDGKELKRFLPKKEEASAEEPEKPRWLQNRGHDGGVWQKKEIDGADEGGQPRKDLLALAKEKLVAKFWRSPDKESATVVQLDSELKDAVDNALNDATLREIFGRPLSPEELFDYHEKAVMESPVVLDSRTPEAKARETAEKRMKRFGELVLPQIIGGKLEPFDGRIDAVMFFLSTAISNDDSMRRSFSEYFPKIFSQYIEALKKQGVEPKLETPEQLIKIMKAIRAYKPDAVS